MTERPITLRAPEVRAILDGRKSQRREVLKPQPDDRVASLSRVGRETATNRPVYEMKDSSGAHVASLRVGQYCATFHLSPPHAPGDQLWVRETLTVCSTGLDYAADGEECADLDDERAVEIWNRHAHADGPDVRTTTIPSIHMPRWASRITLRVTEVRVQRLQEISEDDALAEGVRGNAGGAWGREGLIEDFADLWDSLHKPGAHWDDDPWICAIRFEVVR